mmetsp:Transcript_65481/g.156457  ORF Transcript_65481/g.156457 Transcript_65481/m.156457 type:complete len:206 (+) Transcript_65481:1129-1746(+)
MADLKLTDGSQVLDGVLGCQDLVQQVIDLQHKEQRHCIQHDVCHVPGQGEPKTSACPEHDGNRKAGQDHEGQGYQPLAADALEDPLVLALADAAHNGPAARQPQDRSAKAADVLQLCCNVAGPNGQRHTGEYDTHREAATPWKDGHQIGIDLVQEGIVPPFALEGLALTDLGDQRGPRDFVVEADTVAVQDSPFLEVYEVVFRVR